MALMQRLLPDNPVLTKELRGRMRGARAYWILFGYLGFLAAVLLLSYWSWLQNVSHRGSGGSEAAQLGSTIFDYIVVTQIFLVLFITPAITSGSITLENEQRTMDLLILTRLSRGSIIAGKLLAAVSFTALLLVSSLPLISICFMLGSVDPGMVLSLYMMMLLGSFMIGAFGLMWSSVARTTTQAVMLTYASLFVLTIFVSVVYRYNFNFGTSGNMAENLLQGLSTTWFGASFLGIPGPDGIGFGVLCLLGGLLLSAIAMTQLSMEQERQRKAGILRGFTTLWVGVQLLALNHWWLGQWYGKGAQTVQTVVQPPITVLIPTAIVLMFLVPIFATGVLHPYEARHFGRYLRQGWTRGELKRAKLASGIPFMVALTLFCVGLFALAFVMYGKTRDLPHSARQVTLPSANNMTAPVPPGIPNPNGVRRTPPTPGAAQNPPAGDFPQAVLTLMVSVIGFSLFCLFLSVAFRNRWVACILAGLFLLAIWIVPRIAQADAGSGSRPDFSINLLYLDPMSAIAQMSSPDVFWEDTPLLLGRTPMWIVTSFAWAGLGGLSFLLTLPFVNRERKRTAPVPYEEMIANA